MMRISVLSGLIAVTCLTAVSAACGHSSRLLVSSLSPKGVYRIEASQERRGVERYIYLNAYRDGHSFVRNELLYTGDHLDREFLDLYPDYFWLSDSILKIGPGLAEPHPNEITIKNETPNQISYLLIETYGNKYVLFDVPPEADIKLDFRFIGQLSCQGRFAISNKLFGSAVRLVNDAERETHGDFLIRIKQETPTIESSTLLRYRSKH